MVLLTMTPSIAEALKLLDDSAVSALTSNQDNESSLADGEPGKPISHGQIIDVWKQLKANGNQIHALESLLRGATVYIPPPPPKPEPSDEYKQLMARLRREDEERSYERMLKAPATRETFAQRFPTAPTPMSLADSFAEANRPTRPEDLGSDEITHGEIQKQVTLILNFLISIVGCAAAIWMVSRWWSTTARLLLTLAGSIVVAICEVVVYNAYSWRMEEGEKKQRSAPEVREVVKTWVIGEEPEKEGYEPVLIPPKDDDADGDTDSKLRRRTAATK